MKLTDSQSAKLLSLLVMAIALSADETLGASDQMELLSLKGLAEMTGELEEIQAKAETQAAGDPVSGAEAPDGAASSSELAKPSLASQARAVVTPKSHLVNLNSTLSKEVGQLKAELSRKDQEIAGAQSQLVTAQAQLSTVSDQLAAASLEVANLKRDAKSVDESVEDALSTASVTTGDLPASGSDGSGDPAPQTRDELEAALASCESMAEKIALKREFEKVSLSN